MDNQPTPTTPEEIVTPTEQVLQPCPDESSDQEQSLSPPPAKKPDAMPDEATVSRLLDMAFERWTQELQKAEERGRAKAEADMRRQLASATDRENTVPNFLTDMKPDFWNS